MRILVHGASVSARPDRLEAALVGVAGRGHDVRWLGGRVPEADGVTPVDALRDLHAWHPEVVVGVGAPGRVAWLAWRTHAGSLLLAMDGADFARSSWFDALGWHSLPAFAIVEESQSDAVRAAARHVNLERIALWPVVADDSEPGLAHPDVEFLERACERLLAVRTGRAGRAAVFVDRDGTLIVEEGYLADPDLLRLLPGVAPALRHLQESGLPVVVVSNQAGVGRGRFTLVRAHEMMARLRRVLRAEGVELDAVRFCPHAPDAGCACRKPGIALLQELAEDLRLSLPASVMVGDKLLDASAGQAAGGMGLLVRTGYGRTEEQRLAADTALRAPDGIFDDVAAAARWILERYEEL